MAKTIRINIQIDNVTSKDLPDIEEKIEEALADYLNRRIDITLGETLGPPLPPVEVK
jgi:hypothetical protein